MERGDLELNPPLTIDEWRFLLNHPSSTPEIKKLAMEALEAMELVPYFKEDYAN